MTMESIIASKLSSLGAAYPVTMPAQGATLPGMCYQFISERQMRHHSGETMIRRRLQVSCWAKTYAAAVTLGDSVRAALNLNKTNIELITAENISDFKDPEAELYRRIVEFYVWQEV
jgi:hypothetical protein